MTPDDLSYLRKIIRQETAYLQDYYGKIINITDPEGLGRIHCIIQELGWLDEGTAVWCFPSDKKALITPQVNDKVRIHFMNGNKNQPYYSGIATEFENQIPENYENENSQIIYESNDKLNFIKYNEITKTINMQFNFIELNDATEANVKGDTLESLLNALITALQTFSSGLTTGNLAANATALNTALGTISGTVSNIKSTTIKVS